jgi:DNA modification methylase
MSIKRRPGEIRDAIISVLEDRSDGGRLSEIEQGVRRIIGDIRPSSIRSYLRLNTPNLFRRSSRGYYHLADATFTNSNKSIEESDNHKQKAVEWHSVNYGKSTMILADCFEWINQQKSNMYHAVVTDPPYGLLEYSSIEQEKLRRGKGGIWRIPPSFDGVVRSPLPRFTVLSSEDLSALEMFFERWARLLIRILVPGANVVVASNPLLSFRVSSALAKGGLERRGEIVRLVMTMRGGDRPKAAHDQYPDISVMPRSMWEPWLLFRKPIEGRVQDNLKKWRTGGFRRPGEEKPFGDVIPSSPTHKSERILAPHPSLKPQSFLRVLVRGCLPLGEGVIIDTFAGSGSTLAAAEAVGYKSIGVEKDPHYFMMAESSIPKLKAYKNGENYAFNL